MADSPARLVTLAPDSWRKLVEKINRADGPRPPRSPRRSGGSPENKFRAVLDGALNRTAAATATVWEYDDESSSYVATDLQVEVRGWLLPDGQVLPAGSHVLVDVIGSDYEVYASRECPEDE